MDVKKLNESTLTSVKHYHIVFRDIVPVITQYNVKNTHLFIFLYIFTDFKLNYETKAC